MDVPRPFRSVHSPSASRRLEAARAFALAFPPFQPVTIVASTRGAADDLARSIARDRPATLGLSRFTPTQLAARVAAPRLAGTGIAPSSALGLEAVAARVAFDASRSATLTFVRDVVDTPGFPRALARSLGDLRMAGVASAAAREIARSGAGPDLVRLMEAAERELVEARVADRAQLFEAAAAAVAGEPWLAAPLVLLDVEVTSAALESFLRALAGRASHVLVTLPSQDAPALRSWAGAAPCEALPWTPVTDVERVQAYLFSPERPPEGRDDGSVELFSAPGEGRECVEIARRVLRHARGGVPFDEMAILVRTPAHYQGLLEHALERAGVPACFERGTRRPHPAGRAFLALLACAAEGLSANRFAEYLSLGQLPAPGDVAPAWIAPGDDQFPSVMSPEAAAPGTGDEGPGGATDVDEGQPELAGTLRAPRRWEWMLVEAAVIGGKPERWERRLAGLEMELRLRLRESQRADPDSSLSQAIERDLTRLSHLSGFALPLVREMAAWSPTASWGDWLGRFEQLAPRVLRRPAHVLRVLADLRPMAAVGPVGLDEVRGVLSERLRLIETEPPARRYGRVFVGTPAQARGRAFRVVFVPGLAERMFPQKPRQDPLLPDRTREQLAAWLATRTDGSADERLMLHVAVGAATERLHVSYPRLDVTEARARVPSFYALDVRRGTSGRVPDHEELSAEAARVGDAALAWPAPPQPDDAIDEQEHDLAVLRGLLDAAGEVKGHAQYMLRLSPALRRAVTERWARSGRQWSQFDGVMRVTPQTRAALAARRLDVATYSVSALQRYATCPYQFLLGAIHRLRAAEHPEPLQRLDPLTKGSIVHRMQAVTMRRLQEHGSLPVTRASLGPALAVLDRAVAEVEAEYRERVAPAIDRVWREEIAVIARDLRGWLGYVAEDGGAWEPRYFELGFGLPADPDRDPHSVPDPVKVAARFPLRGAIDAVDVHRETGALRITDHKTGKDRTKSPLVIGGGAVLQPLVYAAVAEQILGAPVAESRLFYCTSAGGYTRRPVPLDAHAREMAVEALVIIDRAVELGRLAPSPAEGACAWCEFRAVCGPGEEERIARKLPGPFDDLVHLRNRP